MPAIDPLADGTPPDYVEPIRREARAFVEDHVEPVVEEYYAAGEDRGKGVGGGRQRRMGVGDGRA